MSSIPICSGMIWITGCVVFGSSSALCASLYPRTSLANSTIESCIPRHRPKKGTLCVRAYLIASSFPSIPRVPNPPGTRIPLTSPSNSSTLSAVTVSESIHLIFTVARLKIPPCFKASTTLKVVNHLCPVF